MKQLKILHHFQKENNIFKIENLIQYQGAMELQNL